jgi:hypothetical protein
LRGYLQKIELGGAGEVGATPSKRNNAVCSEYVYRIAKTALVRVICTGIIIDLTDVAAAKLRPSPVKGTATNLLLGRIRDRLTDFVWLGFFICFFAHHHIYLLCFCHITILSVFVVACPAAAPNKIQI